MRFTTTIPATNKRLHILGSVIGQMSDGIWENTRSMEKYWKSLSYGKDAFGNIYLEDSYGVCADVYDFFANKIKQIIKIEIEDGTTPGLKWERCCGFRPCYIDGIISHNITVGECYELYELLKGRDASKYHYTKYKSYEVSFTLGSEIITFTVEATHPTNAQAEAEKELFRHIKTSVKPV